MVASPPEAAVRIHVSGGAALTALILLVVGLPIAYWVSFSRRRWKFLIEALVAVPLVLPPTVLGFYLLVAYAAVGSMGAQPGGPLSSCVGSVFCLVSTDAVAYAGTPRGVAGNGSGGRMWPKAAICNLFPARRSRAQTSVLSPKGVHQIPGEGDRHPSRTVPRAKTPRLTAAAARSPGTPSPSEAERRRRSCGCHRASRAEA